MNIVCLKFGTKYPSEDVNKLYKSCKRNITLPFNFYCFTEHPIGVDKQIKIIPLTHSLNLQGWWHKLYLFEAVKNLTGRIIYIDLDTLILKNINKLLLRDEKFIVLRDFYTGQPGRSDRWGTGEKAVGSGFMMWNAGELTHIWDNFVNSNPEKIVRRIHPHGDQKWIQEQTYHEERTYFQDFTDEVVSFKLHCKKSLPSNASVVCYHGNPGIADSIKMYPQHTWIAENWK